MKDHDGNTRKRCPLCGGVIEVFFQREYYHVRKITKSDGRLSTRFTPIDYGNMKKTAECTCCDASWDEDDFELTDNGYFIDFKY